MTTTHAVSHDAAPKAPPSPPPARSAPPKQDNRQVQKAPPSDSGRGKKVDKTA